MKLLIPALALFVAGCTPQMETAWFHAKQEWQGYNVADFPWVENALHYNEVQMAEALQEACLSAAENRSLTYTGTAEEITYRQCAATPAPTVRPAPARLSGR